MENVAPFFDGDKRMEKLIDDLNEVIEGAGDRGYTTAAIIGCLDIVKAQMLRDVIGYEG